MLARRTGSDGRGQLTRAAATLAACLAAAPAAGAAPALVTPDADGSDTLLAAVFPDGLPYPFEHLLDRLRATVGAENVATALIPLGRSLQRFAAAPDYFASPRIVVAVTGDAASGPGAPRLANRLFLGYQPAADAVEVIAYDEAAGAFAFDEVIGYSEGAAAAPAEPRVCVACHQSRTPIFSRPLWSESNANPEVAIRLAPLGDSFHGAPVRGTVDDLEAFDAATDRAAAIPLANWLWSEACPDAACRAALLAEALRLGLTGVASQVGPGTAGFEARAAGRWPEGAAAISQDLPNRDPLLESGGTDNPQSTGLLDPETPRGPLPLWQPAPGGFATAAAAVAAQLSPGDFGWIDARLRRIPAAATTVPLACEASTAALPSDRTETRFACTGPDARLDGFFSPDRPGRLALALAGAPRQADLPLAPGGARLPTPSRAGDGRRIEGLRIAPAGAVTLADDLGPLERALAGSGDPALAAGPFRRTAVLTLIATLTGGGDG
ncbi:MAG: hypothetical protein U1E59_04815 [Amaricoccus sp.]